MLQDFRKYITRFARTLIKTPATDHINSSNRNTSVGQVSRDTAHWSKASLSAGPARVPSMSVVLNGPVLSSPCTLRATMSLSGCVAYATVVIIYLAPSMAAVPPDSIPIMIATLTDLTVLYHGDLIAQVPSLPRFSLLSWSISNIPSLVNI